MWDVVDEALYRGQGHSSNVHGFGRHACDLLVALFPALENDEDFVAVEQDIRAVRRVGLVGNGLHEILLLPC